MNKTLNFNRFLAAGIVTALILMSIAAIYIARVMELRISRDQAEQNRNPLLYRQSEEEYFDSDVPEIPGVKVYNAQKDADIIISETQRKESDFKQNQTAKFADKKKINTQRLMRKKDQFAAERLLFLQKIEASETKEERLKLIKELRQICEKRDH